MGEMGRGRGEMRLRWWPWWFFTFPRVEGEGNQGNCTRPKSVSSLIIQLRCFVVCCFVLFCFREAGEGPKEREF